jgi:drug/metabolite transporter (DMT)-like permease
VSRALKAHILLVLITVVWGTTFVLIKAALDDASPLTFNAVRMVLASVCLAIIFRRSFASMTRQSILAGVLVGIFLWLGYEFQTTGLRFTTASKSGFLTGMSNVLVPIFLAIGFRRRVHRWSVVGVTAAAVGLWLLTVPAHSESWMGDFASINLGDLLTMACAVMFALQIISVGWATRRFRFEHISFLQAAVAAVLMSITAPILEQPRMVWTPTVIWAILITGILGTAAAFSVQAWAQQFTPPTHTALIFCLEPVFAWLTSYFWLDERLGWRAAMGAVLIMGGVLISELKGNIAHPEEEVGGPAEATSAAALADNQSGGSYV